MKIRNPKYPFKQQGGWDNCPACFEDFSLDPCTHCGSGFDDEYIEISSELETLRQRVAELEARLERINPLLDEAADKIDALEKKRDELLAAKGKVSVTLTGKEIREIAELAGLQFVEHDYTDEYETEIAIESCPDKDIMNDDNAPEHYRLIAFLNEYPEEGCIGLGEKIEAAAIASVKGGA